MKITFVLFSDMLQRQRASWVLVQSLSKDYHIDAKHHSTGLTPALGQSRREDQFNIIYVGSLVILGYMNLGNPF